MAFALIGENERAWELFALLNPMQHGATSEQIATYKAEPYVIAADVYAVAPHIGRGGWFLDTGTASWLCKVLTQRLLCVRLIANPPPSPPRFPPDCSNYKITYLP